MLTDFLSFVGGAEKYFFELASELASKGNKILLVGGEGNLEIKGVEKFVFKRRREFKVPLINSLMENDFYYLRVSKIVKELMEREEPDVLHGQQLASLGGILAASKHDVPCVVTIHDHWPICLNRSMRSKQGEICDNPSIPVCSRCLRSNLYPTLEKYLSLVYGLYSALELKIRREILFKAKKLIVPSRYLMEKLVLNGYPEEKIKVLPPWVTPIKEFSGRRNLVLFAGRISRDKGIHVLLKAFKQVVKNVPDAKLILAGKISGEAGKILNEGSGKILYRGWVSPDKLMNLLLTTKVTVVPSLIPETFSLIALEAMAKGNIVVASKIGALPEIVNDELNGLLFEPGNIKELSSKLIEVLTDENLSDYLSRNAVEKAKQYEKGKTIKETLNVYRKAATC